MSILKRIGLSLMGSVACGILALFLYWHSEHSTVYRVAESELSSLFKQQQVAVQGVKIVPFTLNMWKVTYQYPRPMRQGIMVSTTAILVKDSTNNWTLKKVLIPK